MISSARTFSAAMGPRERLITYGVGVGVFLGVPLILGVSFAIGFSEPLHLLLPVPFLIALGMMYLFRPTAYAVTPDTIAVVRLVGPKRFPMSTLREMVTPAPKPPGFSFGIIRAEGFFGAFGSYWNRSWGRYHVYVTNSRNGVGLQFSDGSRLILSPDDAEGFVSAVQEAASHRVSYTNGETEATR